MLPLGLAHLLRNSSLVCGRLRIANRAPYRQQIGTRPPMASEPALAAIEQTIVAGLGAQDLQMRLAGPTWLFFFPTLDKASARARCTQLAEKVRQRLSMDDIRWGDSKVECVVIEADLKLLAAAGDPATLIQTMLDEAGREALAGQASGLAETVAEALAREDQCTAQAVRHASQQRTSERPPEGVLGDIEFRFLPVWNASHGVIATHGCEAFRAEAADLVLRGYDTLTQGEDSALVGDLDLATFARAREAVSALLRANDPGIISFPVHWRTLERLEPRRHLTAALEQSSPEERKLLAAQLTGLSEGTPVHRIQEGVNFLQRHTRAVFVRLPPSFIRFDELRGSGAYGVVCDIRSRGSELAEHMKELRRFGYQAKRAGLKLVAAGLGDVAAVHAAIEAGFLNLQGDAISPATDEPHGARPFALPDLIATGLQLGAA